MERTETAKAGAAAQTRDTGLQRFTSDEVMIRRPQRFSRLLSDAVLEKERPERPAGYNRNAYASDPQVVSTNGVLASEAVNTTLDLASGSLPGSATATGGCPMVVLGNEKCEPFARRAGCPTCAEQGHGDPKLV